MATSVLVNLSPWQTSTQRRFWLFNSVEQLNLMRHNVHDQAVNQFLQRQSTLESQLQQQQEAGTATAQDSQVKKKSKKATPLSVEEERALILYYECMVSSLAQLFNPILPTSVQSTTIAFLKRFYLRRSCMDYHPMKVMVCALYMATKCEEHHVPSSHLAERTKSKDQSVESKMNEIVRLEVPLLEGIRFHLKVFHPHKSLMGWISALKRVCKIPADKLTTLESRSKELCMLCYRTDVIFLYTHTYIAIAALHYAAKEISLDEINTMITNQFPDTTKLELVRINIEKITPYIISALAIDINAVKVTATKIDAKLKKCLNASLDPSTPEYAALMVKREAEKASNREIKNQRRKIEEEKKIQQLINANESSMSRSEAGNGDRDDDSGGFVIMKRQRTDEYDAELEQRIAMRQKLMQASDSM